MNLARKYILSILVVASVIFPPVTGVWSQAVTNQVKSSAETSREEARRQRSQSPIAKGPIEAIDLLRHEIKLKTEDGSRIFTYSTRTYIFRDKEKITADSLKVGEIAAVRFSTDKDGNVLLTRIKIRTPSELMPPPSFGPASATNSPAANPP